MLEFVVSRGWLFSLPVHAALLPHTTLDFATGRWSRDAPAFELK